MLVQTISKTKKRLYQLLIQTKQDKHCSQSLFVGQDLKCVTQRRLMIVKMQMNTYKNMEKTNYQSVFQGQDQYHWRMLQRSGILKTKLRTLCVMVSNLDFKLAYKTLTIYFQLTLVNSLLSLVFHLPVKVILSTKWLLAITKTMAGKRRLLHQKMYQHIYMRIS